MKNKNIKNLVNDALDDISGIPERKKTHVPVTKDQRRTRQVCFRFPEKDMEKLEGALKLKTGETSLSAGIRKLIYIAMKEEDLL